MGCVNKAENCKEDLWHFIIMVVALAMFWLGFICGASFEETTKQPIIENIGVGTD